MNIISNNCISGILYNRLNIKYENPFVWSFISGNDFFSLINNFDKLDFNNITIVNSCLDKIKYKNTYSIIIDNKIYVHYIHYIFDKNFEIPTKRKSLTGEPSRDILFNNAKQLCIDNYLNRVKRMNNNPIFIVDRTPYITKEDIINCLYLNSKYKRIFLLSENFDYDKNKVNKNCEIILRPKDKLNVYEKSSFILKQSSLFCK